MAYVSITGFRAKSVFHVPVFVWHALRSMAQAQRDPSCRFASARLIKGVAHTVTVWDSRLSMLAFMTAGDHRKAMRAFSSIGTGYGFGYDGDDTPHWNKVHQLWLDQGPSKMA
jgi:hypothetical protein